MPDSVDWGKAYAFLADECVARDSLGVHGSEFLHCMLCNSCTDPGKSADFVHKPTCPTIRCIEAAQEDSNG